MLAFLALWLLSCEPSPEPGRAAPQEERQQLADLVSRWAQADAAGRRRIIGQLDAMAKPEATIVALSQLDQAASGTLTGIDCDGLHQPSAHAACLKVADRPHLRAGNTQAQAQAQAQAQTSEPTQLRSPAAVPWPPLRPGPHRSPLAQVAPTLGCEDSPVLTACSTTQAAASLQQEASTDSALQAAAGACNRLKGPDRDECWFRAAEQVAGQPDLDVALRAVPACFAAGDFVHECLSHAVDGWTRRPPLPSDRAGIEAWQTRLRALSTAIAGQTQGPEAQTIDDVLHACATERVVRHAPGGSRLSTDSGRAVDLHASLAARLLDCEGPSQGTASLGPDEDELDRLASLVVDLASGQQPLPEATLPEATLPEATLPDPPLRDVSVLWEVLTPADASWLAAHTKLRVVPYRGYSNAVRITSPDPHTDAAVALVEAAARCRRSGSSALRDRLLQAGRQHPAEAVQWTSSRVLRVQPSPG